MSDVADTSVLDIEVAYALPERQWLVAISVPQGTTARQALSLSGLADEAPGLDINSCPVGVFGRVVPDDYELSNGERVEIYRPLLHDPREQRRALAQQGSTMGKGGSED